MLNAVGASVITGISQCGSPAAAVAEGTVGGAPLTPLLVGPEPSTATRGTVIGEVAVEPIDTGLVVKENWQSAELGPLARAEPIRVSSAEAAECGGGNIECVGDFAPRRRTRQEAPGRRQ